MRLIRLAEDATLDSAGLFIKLPASLAKNYPKLNEDSSDPHVTVLYIGDIETSKKSRMIDIIKRVAKGYDPIDVWIGGVAYFTNQKDEKIAHSMVEAKGLASLSRDIWDALLRDGIKVEHSFPDYTPHVTLQYGDSQDYDGPVPEGNFTCKELELWVSKGKKIASIKLGP